MNLFLKTLDIALCQKLFEIQEVSFGMIWQREMLKYLRCYLLDWASWIL